MVKSLTFLAEVPEDIEAAHEWYVERSPAIANRFLTALELVLRSIELSPQRGGFHDARRLYRYRRVGKFPFIVVYRELEERTLIVAIYHMSRRPDFWKRVT
jgi:plasmid stabilization system protein ParE